MAYDKIKAHEYYIKYRKKGLKKGRRRKRVGDTDTTTQRKTRAQDDSLDRRVKNYLGKKSGVLGRGEQGEEDKAEAKKRKQIAKLYKGVQKQREKIAKQQEKQEAKEKKAAQKAAKDSQRQAAAQQRQAQAAQRAAQKAAQRQAAAKKKQKKAEKSEMKTTVTMAQPLKKERKKKAIQKTQDQAQAVVDTVMEKLKAMSPEDKALARENLRETITHIEEVYDSLLRSGRMAGALDK